MNIWLGKMNFRCFFGDLKTVNLPLLDVVLLEMMKTIAN